jgi:transcriptional regulator with XRE-family HTH domain
MTDADDDADFAEAFKMVHARLRTLRLLVGLTEQEMAVRMSMSEHAYTAWETPERSSRGFPLFAIRLAERFGVSIDWIATGGQMAGPRNDEIPQAPGGGPLPSLTRH